MNIKKKIMMLTATAILGSSLASGAAFADSVKVQKGDTLWSLSVKHNTNVTTLKKLNGLSTNTIYIGQNIKVSEEKSTSSTSYVVKRGDTLSKIGAIHNISYLKIKEWNKLTSNTIYVGQVLKLEQISSQPREIVSNPITTSTFYTVKRGDTLSKIGASYNVSYLKIKEWNNLRSNTIYPGQKLTVKAPDGNVQKAPSIDAKRAELISFAKKFLGVPYAWGGQTPRGFDCSGFMYYTLSSQDLVSSRMNTASYWKQIKKISNPQPGDLVFFQNTYTAGPSHMGIYLGNNEFIHAGVDGISIDKVNNSYWGKHFLGYGTYFQ